jgi:hypothetical protein
LEYQVATAIWLYHNGSSGSFLPVRRKQWHQYHSKAQPEFTRVALAQQ